jgi:hypothetical protein
MKDSPKTPSPIKDSRSTHVKDAKEQLASFLAKYNLEIAARAESILRKMRKLHPTSVELVYDNYNALAIGFGPSERASEAIFSIALYPRWVSLFFLQASGLSDPDKILQGKGKVAKHIVLTSPEVLNSPAVRALMQMQSQEPKPRLIRMVRIGSSSNRFQKTSGSAGR